MVRRRRLGAEFRQLREQHKLTNRQLAARMGWSVAKLSRLENARARTNLADIMDLLDHFGVVDGKREQLVALARDSINSGGWWQKYSRELDEWHVAYAEMENGAVEIREFQMNLIPGLLQTADYARARANARASVGLSPINVDDAVQARLERQMILTRDAPLAYEAIVEDITLIRRCGPPGVRRGQLDQLVKLADLPNVTIRLLHYEDPVADYWVPPCAFSLYRFADPEDPEVVMLEAHSSDIQLGDVEDVKPYQMAFDRLRDAALSPEESIAMIEAARDDVEEES